MPPTRLIRRPARWARGDSATAAWIRRTRRLSPSRGGSCSRRGRCRRSRRTDQHDVLVRVVVLAGAVMDLAAWMAALHLDRGVPDRKATAQAAFQLAHDVLGVAERALLQNDVSAESHLL